MKPFAIFFLIFLICLGGVFYPKQNVIEGGTCGCQGIATDLYCFGIPGECSLDPVEERVEERTRGTIDLSLVIDTSSSMGDGKLTLAKNAMNILIDNFLEEDRLSIISFSNSSTIEQTFTTSKTTLQSVVDQLEAKDNSNYLPALDQIRHNYLGQSTSRDYVWRVIFLSDGEPSDEVPIEVIYDHVEDLARSQICLYTIGFSAEGEAREVLEEMAHISYQHSGCGAYFQANKDANELLEIYYQIYGNILNESLEIKINEPKEKKYTTSQVLLDFETSVPAECKYQLNNRNWVTIHGNGIPLRPFNEENIVHIVCEKTYGFNDRAEKYIRFDVDKKSYSPLFSLGKTFGLAKEIEKLEGEDLNELLLQVAQLEGFSVTQRISGDIVYVIVKNNKPLTAKNVVIKQTFPFPIDPSEFTSNKEYHIDSSAPLRLSYSLGDFEPGQSETIVYTIHNREVNKEIETKVLYDNITREDVEVLLSTVAKEVEAEHQFRKKGTNSTGIIYIEPTHELAEVKVYLNIPKCMAHHIDKMYFHDKNFKIIAEDPMILWEFSELTGPMEMDYELEGHFDDDCAKDLAIIPLVEEIGDPLKNQSSFFPLSVIGIILVVVILYFYQGHLKDMVELPTWTSYAFIAAVAIVILMFIFFPKPIDKDEQFCQCIGVLTDESCYGIPYACDALVGGVQTQTGGYTETCAANACSDISQYLRINPSSYTSGTTDLVLILDHSRSMEIDDKLDQAKAASLNLLNLMDKHDRIALVEFDNSSKLLQPLTSNKTALTNAIQSIGLGFTTQYLPALDIGHLNFLLESDRANDWQVIFISDGVPSDAGKPDSIYAKVRQMAQDSICVNTIGFGSEITPGSEAETILKQMAQISFEITGCGSYYYAPKDIGQLADILGRVYLESSNKKLGLQIDASVQALELTTQENLAITARVQSNLNKQLLPGSFAFDDQAYCSPAVDLNLELSQQGQVVRQYRLAYDGRDYILDQSNIPVGKYDAHLVASLPIEEECPVKGTLFLGELIVSPFDGFKECFTDECREVSEYLNTLVREPIIEVSITDYAFIPRNITISDGTIVTWTNNGRQPHTVTSGHNVHDGKFHSGILLPGDSYNITFEKGGEFRYFDNLSTELRGNVAYNRSKNLSATGFTLKYNGSLDLTLLVDSSGSMFSEGKMSKVQNATQQLVEMLYPGDKLSVIRFSDKAFIDTLFTEQKDVTLSKINALVSGGLTFYIPALEKVEKYYELREDEQFGQIVILLSDGIPWDEGKPNSIYDTVKRLSEKGICVYTIGYGPDIFPGSEAERILRNIVEISQSSNTCGQYFYTPSEETRLIKIFGAIYYEAKDVVEGLRVFPVVPKRFIYDNETLPVTARVKSAFNSQFLPGYIEEEDLCGPPAQVTAAIFDETNTSIQEIPLEYVGEATGYRAELFGLDPGNYELAFQARSAGTNGNLCDFEGIVTVPLQVRPTQTNNQGMLLLIFATFFICLIGVLFYVFKRDVD